MGFLSSKRPRMERKESTREWAKSPGRWNLPFDYTYNPVPSKLGDKLINPNKRLLPRTNHQNKI